MNYRLDKLVGRAPLPGDEVAFERVARMFKRAGTVKVKVAVQPAAKKKATATRKRRVVTTGSARKAAP